MMEEKKLDRVAETIQDLKKEEENTSINENPFIKDAKFFLNEFVLKNIKRMDNLYDILTGKYSNKRGITPYEVIYRKNRFRVLRYISNHPKRFKVPIVFVFALINRYYVLDIAEGRSLVQYLLEKGFDVYMIDWGIPSKVEGKNTIADYIEKYLDKGVDKVREISGQDKVTVFGYCLGAIMSLVYAARFPEKLKNLALLTPPVDFGGDDGVLTVMTNEKYLDLDRITGYYEHLIPAEFLQSGFDFKNLIGSLLMPSGFWEVLASDKALESFFPMHHWVHDNIPIASQFWKEYIQKFYRENAFMNNNLSLNGKKLNFKDIKCPVLAIAAAYDDIVTLKCAEGALKIVGSEDKSMIVKKAGHVGVVTGSMASKEVWPDIFPWLAARSERIVVEKGNVEIVE